MQRRRQRQQQQQGQDQQQGQPEPQLQGQPQEQAKPAQQPEGDQASTRDAMRFLGDRRPARSLSDAELRRRIAVGQSLMGNRDLRDKVRGRVQSLLGEAQNELAGRDRQTGQGQGQGGQGQGGQGQGQAQGGTGTGRRRAAGGWRPGPLYGRPPSGFNLERPGVAPAHQVGPALLQSGAGQGQRGQIEGRVNEDRNELRNRLQQANGGAVPGGALDQPSAAEGEARRILSDRRASGGLDELPQPRDRVQRTRGVLAAEGLSNDMSERLRDRLRDDRDELRNRVSVQEDRQRDRSQRADQRDEGPVDYGQARPSIRPPTS